MERGRAPTKKLAEKWRRPSVADDVKVCQICSRDLVDPRTLPCMHSFCEECLFVLLRCYELAGKLDRTFFCPTCQVRIPCHIVGRVSRDWLKMFPEKSSIDKMKEAILVVEEMCSPCSMSWKLTPATVFCEDCQTYMCPACGGDHASNPNTKPHNTVDYIVREMKTVPVSNISKFNCKDHNNLRYTSYCDVHQVFLCNTCKNTAAHRNCRLSSRVIEATGVITKAETKLNVINTLKRDESGKGKQLLRLVEQIDVMQETLARCRQRQLELYCNYVMQATLIEQKSEAIDALKGKLEFVKNHQPHDVIYKTMNKVEELLTRYVDLFPEVGDSEERAANTELGRSISEIEKILNKPVFAPYKPGHPAKGKYGDKKATPVYQPREKDITWHPTSTDSDDTRPARHVCKRHVEDGLTEETLVRLCGYFRSVGAICFKNMSATAFRVGSNYVMTTAHTVRDIVDPDRSGKSDWTALEDPGVYLTFTSPMTSQSVKFRLHSKVEFLDDELNVAVLRVLDSEHPLPPPVVLSRKNVTSVGVTEVAAIGYGHAGSYSKHLDAKCAIIDASSSRANDAAHWLKDEEILKRCTMSARRQDPSSIKWSYDVMKDDDRVTIDTCLEYRALGAPVFCNTGSSGAEVLGIITHSVPECFSEMSRDAQERFKAYRFELVTKTSRIYEKLSFETRVLADDIFIKDKNYYDYSKYEQESSLGSVSGMMTSLSTGAPSSLYTDSMSRLSDLQ